jgi:antiphage defense system Thoeris ThsA-like protein
MLKALGELFKQPYWVVALILGVALIAAPSLTIEKDNWSTHPPTTFVPVYAGALLLVLSVAAFAGSIWERLQIAENATGLDLTRVREGDGILSTIVSGCEIRVIEGRIEECKTEAGMVIALPCNEYFDDECVGDTRSALGAYVNRAFEGQCAEFAGLVRSECARRLPAPEPQRKTDTEEAPSFGAGRCILLQKPLGRSAPIALVSTTTQRAGQGLASRISYLFDGMQELVKCLADARLNEVIMPVLGSGHGRIDPPLALVGLLLAVAEAARYGQGSQRLRSVTVVVFRRDADSSPEVDRALVRRALALVGSPV